MSENLGFAGNFRKYFREKKTLRWLLFAYPKSFISTSLGCVGFFCYFMFLESKKAESTGFAIKNALHSDENSTRRSDFFLIYGKDKDSK